VSDFNGHSGKEVSLMAAPNFANRGGFVWAILVTVLAIPGFLFYNWWSHLKADHDRGVSAKARARLSDGSVFQKAPASGRLVNPMTVSSSAPAAVSAPALPSKAAAPAGVRGPVPVALGNVAAATAAAPAPAAIPPKPVASISIAPAAAAPTASVQLMASTVTVVLSRDPMLSPIDTVRLREIDLERVRNEEARRRELEDLKHPRPRQPRKETPIDRRIELQGIVAKPGGASLAIINGATVSNGEQFSVRGYPSKVKIIRISAEEVTFDYKGKRFKKRVNVE
jgi:hypothetical protein